MGKDRPDEERTEDEDEGDEEMEDDDSDSDDSSSSGSDSDGSSSSDSDSDSDSDDDIKSKSKGAKTTYTTATPDKKVAPKMSLAEAAEADGSPKKSKKAPAKDNTPAQEKKKTPSKAEPKKPSNGKKADDADDDDDDLETAKREVHRTDAWYVVRVFGDGDPKVIRAVAIQRKFLCFGDDERATTILEYDDDYLQSTVMMVMPGDIAEAVGMEGGIVKARGLSKNIITADAKRMVDMGLRRSGTMVLPPAYVFEWLRSIPGISKKAIARVEAAVNNPECYEVSSKTVMNEVGPPKVARANPKSGSGGSRAKKAKPSHGSSSKKRKGSAAGSASAAAANGDGEDRARPLKRGRFTFESDIVEFLHILGQSLVDATEKYGARDA